MAAAAAIAHAQKASGRHYLDSNVEVGWAEDHFVLAHVGGLAVHDLSPAQALALSLLAENGDVVLTRATLEAVSPLLPSGLDQVVARFPTYLRGATSRPFDRSAWGERARMATRRPAARMGAPASVTWIVTFACNRRCPYCFYKIDPVDGPARHRPADATLSSAEALGMVESLASVGTADLYLTGGEPLLRDDVTEVIAAASARGMRVHVVSKYPIDLDLAEELAEAGLHRLTLSIDDFRPLQSRRLTGCAEYAAEAFAALAACLQAGLQVEVNAVLTTVNQDALPELARRLEAHGCPRMTVSPIQEPYFRQANTSALQGGSAVLSVLGHIRDRLGGRMDVAPGLADAGGSGDRKPCGSELVCEVGTRSLHILPNGDVTRCHYVPSRPELIIGSVRDSSIMDIWTGATLRSWLQPDRTSYAGTACSGCGGFDACNGRGRCVASALLDQGRTHAPDAFCARQ